MHLLKHSKYKPTNSKGLYSRLAPEVGRVVMIHDEDMRLGWRMGIITELVPSSDGQVRSAIVKTTLPSKKLYLPQNLCISYRKKAVKHLYPLELQVEGYEDRVFPPAPYRGQVTEGEVVEAVDERWDQCSDPGCSRPREKSLRWIMCESCDGWNHFACAGLDEKKSYDDCFFACRSCWGPSLPLVLGEDDAAALGDEVVLQSGSQHWAPTDPEVAVGPPVVVEGKRVADVVHRVAKGTGELVGQRRPVRRAAVKCRDGIQNMLGDL